MIVKYLDNVAMNTLCWKHRSYQSYSMSEGFMGVVESIMLQGNYLWCFLKVLDDWIIVIEIMTEVGKCESGWNNLDTIRIDQYNCSDNRIKSFSLQVSGVCREEKEKKKESSQESLMNNWRLSDEIIVEWLVILSDSGQLSARSKPLRFLLIRNELISRGERSLNYVTKCYLDKHEFVDRIAIRFRESNCKLKAWNRSYAYTGISAGATNATTSHETAVAVVNSCSPEGTFIELQYRKRHICVHTLEQLNV